MTQNLKPVWQRGDSLLASFAGSEPPRAPWIDAAYRYQPERSLIDVDGADIELLTWGDIGKPGVLLLHGAGAQADWWSHIAPLLCEQYRVAAISWSGMGRSSWRDGYDLSQWANEAQAAITAASLDLAGKPVVAAHSLGGSALLYLAANHSEYICAGIMIDSFVPNIKPGTKPPSPAPLKIYAHQADALARYRFMPEQGTDFPEIVDFIARQSLREVSQDGGKTQGWTWRFDPSIISKLDISMVNVLMSRVAIPMAVITGAKSGLMKNHRLDDISGAFSNCQFSVSIPEAGHHIMIDQPLALVSALHTMLPKLMS